MKLYLSSYRIPYPEKFFDLIGKDPAETSGAIITNAKEKHSEVDKAIKLAALQNDLSKIGLNNTVAIDLRKEIPDLNEYNFIFAAGGNTFDLRRAMVETGFDERLRDYLDKGGVYVGESAGAIAIGPSLRGFQVMDHQSDNPIWDGMGLIDTIIVPHNDSSDPVYNNRAPYVQKLNPDYKVTPLGDNEDYIIDE